ncbi:MAG: SHOCT domain-containing protein [Clostridia bacterium]|nr:SHOCT domain-containing protein [Clostridia bacterium]
MANCNVCGEKLPFIGGIKVSDGVICGSCSNLSGSYQTETIQNLKTLYNKNEQLKRIFNETQCLKSFMGDSISIDSNNRLFCIPPRRKGFNCIIHSLDDITGYEKQVYNTVTETKTKGGITRAVVGTAIAGPLGGIVGASTAKQVSNTKEQFLFYIVLNEDGNVRKLFIDNPPIGLSEFIDRTVLENQSRRNSSAPTNDNTNRADSFEEIKKFKELLDMSVISQDEFDAKKKELLNL